jgi:DNA-binding HxlR family transcriptional regulator
VRVPDREFQSTIGTSPVPLLDLSPPLVRDDLEMSDYNRYCPISMGSDVIADRWTPLIVRELVLGNTRFNDIARGLPGISRSLLVRRLNHLERTGVIERWPSPAGKGSEYLLTSAGRDLEKVLVTLGRWSVQWLYQELRPREIDAQTLMWWMHRLVVPEKLPTGRVVVEFRHTAPVRLTIWMVIDRGEVSVCMQHPGYDSDLVVTSPTTALSGVFSGVDSWPHEVAEGTIVVDGPPRLARALPTWFQWGLFGPEMRAAEHRVLAN